MVAVRRAAITGRVQIASTEIAPLLAMLDERRIPLARGTVRADFNLRGTVGAPELVGEVIVARGRAGAAASCSASFASTADMQIGP